MSGYRTNNVIGAEAAQCTKASSNLLEKLEELVDYLKFDSNVTFPMREGGSPGHRFEFKDCFSPLMSRTPGVTPAVTPAVATLESMRISNHNCEDHRSAH